MPRIDVCTGSIKDFFEEADFLIPQLVETAKTARRLGNGRPMGHGYVRLEAAEELAEMGRKLSGMQTTVRTLGELREQVLRNCETGPVMSFRQKQFRTIRD